MEVHHLMGFLDRLGEMFGGAGFEGARLVTTAQDVEALFAEPEALLYKHSPICGVCSSAVREVRKLREEKPDLALYVVDVIADRRLSQQIATRSGVVHASPQVLLFRDGAAVWDTSHFDIRMDAMQSALEGA